MKVGRISTVWTDMGHSRTAKCLEWDEPIAEDDDEVYINKMHV